MMIGFVVVFLWLLSNVLIFVHCVPSQYYDIIVSELMYGNRQGELDLDNALEFVEFKNVGSLPIDMSNWVLSGFGYQFDAGTVLLPGAFYTLARVPAKFEEFYGVRASNTRIVVSQLANSGEQLVLRSGPQPLDPLLEDSLDVLFMEYSDDVPWPVMADDRGFSLVPRDASRTFDHSDPARWRASSRRNGSPTVDDPPLTVPEIVINEVLTNPSPSDLVGDFVELYNPTAAAVNLSHWVITDQLADTTKFIFPPSTIIEAYDYLVLNESQLGFGLSSLGDDIYLLSRDARDFTGYSHGIDFGAAELGRPFGRVVNGVLLERFMPLEYATPGHPNAPLIAPAVAIVEINYHPLTSTAAGAQCTLEIDCEYVRLRNRLRTDVHLYDPALNNTAWRMSALNFTFPAGLTLAPGADVYVTTAAPDALRRRFGIANSTVVLGPALGALSNGGESITLFRPTERATTAAADGEIPFIIVDRVAYRDSDPWPVDADGLGKSLHRCDDAELGDDAANWNIYSPCTRMTHPPTPAAQRVRTPAPSTAPPGSVGGLSLTSVLIIFAVVLVVAIGIGLVAYAVVRRRRRQSDRPPAATKRSAKTTPKSAGATVVTAAAAADTTDDRAVELAGCDAGESDGFDTGSEHDDDAEANEAKSSVQSAYDRAFRARSDQKSLLF
jgi:hypothetical protein